VWWLRFITPRRGLSLASHDGSDTRLHRQLALLDEKGAGCWALQECTG
jgi:hypothetical protein